MPASIVKRKTARSSERRAVSPLPAIAAAFIIALLYLIMLGADKPLDAFGETFRPPEKMVWCVLVAAQVAIWCYLAPPAYRRASRYASSFRGHRRAVILDLIVLVILFAIFAYAHREVTSGRKLPVAWQEAKVLPLMLLGFATLLPCLIGMRLIAIAARAEAVADVNTAMLDRFARLRADLKWFLGGAALIIGAATFTNGAFRNALNAINDPKNPLPATEVLLYGGFCSAVLGLFYLTSHEVFNGSGWALIKAVEPVLDDSASAWADAQARRSKLAEVMGIGTSSMRAFQDGAVILTPLAGSGVALLLGK
ncbi:MAG TPA: hypothetical protein VEK57_19045 [Thermoanaerobaculia bacterium]|nr:hypothetical protein [Thermoanaerobaculia bacterium]